MLKDIIYNNLAQGLQFGSRWVLNLSLISLMDIKLYAVFSFIYSLSNILYSILPFGSPDYMISESDKPTEMLKKLANSIVVVSVFFICIILFYFILTPFLNNLKGWPSYLYGIILGFVLSLNLVLFSYFKAIGNFKKELYAYSFFCFILLFFTAYYYFITKSIMDFIFIFEFLIVLNSLMTLYVVSSSGLKSALISEFRNLKINRNQFKEFLNLRLYFGLQEIVTALYTQAGLLILFYFLDKETYGYYRALFVIIAPIMMVSVAISQVVLKYLKSIPKHKIVYLFRKTILYTIGFGVLISISLSLLKEYLFDFIKIETNETTQVAFIIIIVVILLRFLFFNYEVLLVVFDKQKERFLITLTAVAISSLSIFFLLPEYGLIGAVSTNLISNAIVAIGLITISESYLKNKA